MWRPEVASWVGSFTDILGDYNYPPMIRKVPRKPPRGFLQDGENDLNVPAGEWWLANLEMAALNRLFAGVGGVTGRGVLGSEDGGRRGVQ